MNAIVEKKIEQTILTMCDWVQKVSKECSTDQLEILPSVLDGIAELVRALKD